MHPNPVESRQAFSLDNLGECIGLESCVDLIKDLEQELAINPSRSGGHGGGVGGGRRRKEKSEREYPPPIPWLVRTENFSSHMPWVMKRHYPSEGRLVITKERAKRHEYFQADRSGGRLTLRLVPLNDSILEDTYKEQEEEEEEEGEEEEMEESKKRDEKRKWGGEMCCEISEGNCENVEEESMGCVEGCCMEDGAAAKVGGGEERGVVEWYGCDGLRGVSGCRYGMAVPSTFSPVHS